MKKMHVQSRLLSLLLVLALLWGFAAPASAAGAAHRDGVSFTQVDNSAVSASLLGVCRGEGGESLHRHEAEGLLGHFPGS